MPKKHAAEKKVKVQESGTKKTIFVCKRCGTCCMKGGPALHREDRELIAKGHIGYGHLVTIRKGEPAYSPLSERLEPVQKEIVKLAGKEKGKGWACCLYDEEGSSCTIYRHRPLECRLLKCRDTSELLSVIGRDTLTRADIISREDPLRRFIEMHEKKCSVEAAENLVSVLMEKSSDSGSLAKLTALVQQDLAIRSKAVSEFSLSLQAELFYFGRPLFKILGSRGIQV